MGLSEYALTSVVGVKDYMGSVEFSNTRAVESLINAVTDRIERECSRKFKARDFQEWYNVGPNQLELLLNNYPIIRAPRISFGIQLALNVSYSGSAIEADFNIAPDRAVLRTVAADGTATTTDFLFSEYKSTKALATALSAVSGITATIAVNIPVKRMNPNSGFDLLRNPAYCTYPDITLYNPSVNYDNGAVAVRYPQRVWVNYEYPVGKPVLPNGYQRIFAEYRAGYETIPESLSMIANQLVADLYNSGQKDFAIKSEKLDQYAYTLVDRIDFSEQQRHLMSNFMRLGVGGN